MKSRMQIFLKRKPKKIYHWQLRMIGYHTWRYRILHWQWHQENGGFSEASLGIEEDGEEHAEEHQRQSRWRGSDSAVVHGGRVDLLRLRRNLHHLTPTRLVNRLEAEHVFRRRSQAFNLVQIVLRCKIDFFMYVI